MNRQTIVEKLLSAVVLSFLFLVVLPAARFSFWETALVIAAEGFAVYFMAKFFVGQGRRNLVAAIAIVFAIVFVVH